MGSFGSKAVPGLCEALISLMPPHSLYLETHLGGGALMKRKPPAERSIGIDLDERALAAFSCDTPVELVHGCAHAFLDAFPFQVRIPMTLHQGFRPHCTTDSGGIAPRVPAALHQGFRPHCTIDSGRIAPVSRVAVRCSVGRFCAGW